MSHGEASDVQPVSANAGIIYWEWRSRVTYSIDILADVADF
jgi:hypothetical protein